MAIGLVATLGTSPNGVPRVKLDATWTTAPVPSSVTLYRSDPSGARVVVRQGDPLLLAAGLGTAYDYEAPFDQPVTYYVSNGVSESASAAVTLTSDGVPWLVHAGQPEISVPLPCVTRWPSWSRPIEQGVFRIIGRRTPVVTSARRNAESGGTLELATLSATEADQLVRILADGTPLLLKGTAVDDPAARWVAVGDTTETPADPRAPLRSTLLWQLPLQVVDSPAGQALAAATFGDVAAKFATFADQQAQVPTFAGLTAGAWL